MTIRARLLIALGLLYVTMIGTMMLAIWHNGKVRVQEETTASMRSVELMLRQYISNLPEGEAKANQVAHLVSRDTTRRHVKVDWVPTSPDLPLAALPTPGEQSNGLKPVIIPVVSKGQQLGHVQLEPDPEDEMAEVNATLLEIAQFALALAIAGILLTTWLINRALSPVEQLAAALNQLSGGNYQVTLPDDSAPEIAVIADRVRYLANRLNQMRSENQELSRSIVRIQDEERKDIARELHDEFGPFLFAIRASASTLSRIVSNAPNLQQDVTKITSEISSQIDALQLTNRRVLSQLAPDGLAELGLSRALEAMVEMWKRQNFEPKLSLTLSHEIDAVDQTTALTAYRMAQEAITNAHRHSGADNITLSLELTRHNARPTDGRESPSLTIRIRDDGRGISPTAATGFGLRGMRERVVALGGQFSINTLPGTGTELVAELPTSTNG